MEFNQKELAKLPAPAKVQRIPDPTHPALYIQINPSGSKSWYFVYRLGGRGSKQQWMKVGDFMESTGKSIIMPLNRAQELARAYRTKVDAGTDPKRELEAAAVVGTTIADLCQKFENEVLVKKSQSTQDGYGGSIKLWIKPGLGKVQVRELTRDQVTIWHSRIPYPVAANRALSCLRRMLNLAIDVWDMRPDQINVARKVERNEEEPRKRDVERSELLALGDALRALEGSHSLWALAAVKVVALCFGRVSEVLGLKRGGCVLDAKMGGYSILKQHKNIKKEGIRRLEIPPEACRIMLALPRLEDNPYYFPGRIRNRPLTRDGLHKTWMAVREKAGLAEADIVIHDFRSLAESEGEEQGISETTRATMMGHSAATARRHYTKSRKVAEAAAMISAPIAAALNGKPKRKK